MSADELKKKAAERALQFVEPGMKLGLGTGSTAAAFVDLLGVEYLDAHPFAPKDPPMTAMPPEELTKNQRGGLRMLKQGVGPKAEIMRKTTLPKNIPVRIITAGQPWWLTPEEDRAWREAHKQMAASISGAELIVAEESDHLIPEKQPEVIVEALKEVIQLSK